MKTTEINYETPKLNQCKISEKKSEKVTHKQIRQMKSSKYGRDESQYAPLITITNELKVIVNRQRLSGRNKKFKSN